MGCFHLPQSCGVTWLCLSFLSERHSEGCSARVCFHFFFLRELIFVTYMVGSHRCISQTVLSELQNSVPHPCEPQLLSCEATRDVVATGRIERVWKLCCLSCAPHRRTDGSSPLGVGAQALGSPSLSFFIPFWLPKGGKRPTGAGVKSEAACVTFLCRPHTGPELSVEFPGLLQTLRPKS